MRNDKFNPHALNLLKERGLIHTMSHPTELADALARGPVTFYLGIDPTADNLHIGHFFAMQVFKILQDHGHNGVLLIGNATAMIGDPSFKNDMRKLLTKEEVDHNAREISALLDRFIDTKHAKIVYNADWMRGENFINFMREVGTHFNVAKMLSAECYKNRLREGGLTFFEMGYMLMQSYDFVHLNDAHGVTLQIGGSDQWGNIVAGVELGRKMALKNGNPRPLLMALCNPLLVKADGTKMGKTEKGTLWVSRDKDGAYNAYQHFVNVFDEDVERLLMFFTDLSVKEVKQMCEANIVVAKKRMAYEVTKKIHGVEEADAARATSEKLFSSASVDTPPADTPTETIKLSPGATIADILAQTSIIKSKREARELITSGAIYLDNTKITDINFIPTTTSLLIRKGKKTYLRIVTKA